MRPLNSRPRCWRMMTIAGMTTEATGAANSGGVNKPGGIGNGGATGSDAVIGSAATSAPCASVIMTSIATTAVKPMR